MLIVYDEKILPESEFGATNFASVPLCLFYKEQL